MYKIAEILLESAVKKLKKIASEAKGRDEKKYLDALSTLSFLEYTYNQDYVDEFIENEIICYAKNFSKNHQHDEKKNIILFYDGFGFDTRGLIQTYLTALAKLKYKIIYVTTSKNENEQPEVISILKETDCKIYHCENSKQDKRLSQLREIISKENFDAAFLYTSTWDIAGIIAFTDLKGICKRYLINLTDHAFWPGLQSFDYCIEFRDYGASVSKYYRGIPQERLLKLPYYPIINKNVKFLGFPDSFKNKKVIFSGGNLYKTIDSNNTYYKLVEHIINNHSDVVFLYAGFGDSRRMNELIKKYPRQVFFINERKDLFEVLKHSYLYLNTYPIGGALMLQYAALASCVPVTLKLKFDDDASGILRNEDKLGEIFTDFNEVCKEIDKLINNEEYLNEKRGLLSGMVISPEEFSEILNEYIQNPVSPYLENELKKIDTLYYRKVYKNNFKITDVADTVWLKDTPEINKYFLHLLPFKIYSKIMRTIKGAKY